MRNFLIFVVFFCFVEDVTAQSTATIGAGTGAQEQPFGIWVPYERSAAIYLKSEINYSYGLITTLGWYVATTDPNLCPIRIYLRNYSSATFTASTWATMISLSTLVYDQSVSFTTTGWKTLDISDFAYTTGNLLVLCETNYGGTSGSTSYPTFRYTYTVSKHQFWEGYDVPPTLNGTVNDNRPNIQVTYTPLGTVTPPSGFMAKATSTSQVTLSWKKNAASNNVMVAYSTTNTFGVPSGTYSAGNSISGGGTVIYNGTGTSFSQTTGLNPATTYYYMAWSVTAAPLYSAGSGSNVTTFCNVTNLFPSVEDMEGAGFPPICWSQAGLPWIRSVSASGFGSGTASAKVDFFNIVSGNFDLISEAINIAGLTDPVVRFDHAYATYTNQVDKLELWYSTNNGATYTLLTTWLGGVSGALNTGGVTSNVFVPTAGQWATKSYALPPATNRVMFRGISSK